MRLDCKGFVYVLRGKTSGNYKIGFTKGVASRARDLAYQVGESLEILAAFPGTELDEARLLRKVHPHRIVVAKNGEWLRPHADVVALVESLHPATRINYSLDVVQRKSRKPRRPSEEVERERRERFLKLHGHEDSGRWIQGCVACKRLARADARTFARERAARNDPPQTAWAKLYTAINAHCAQAPALTGGA